ncbi:hypothetical protein [Methylobrevis pamukkalensis]|uniref:Uncharacterized protein n=1 Tax=Methylobrevis pamukkalensis TaxID=1439726 RepID=A0A1E3H2C8_9HYPH|nr:hypothetical protein [Methylobrevis pamukkalensis]ODN70483.1 hypothetical protein A6302_02159 [Methylobrevis pamukkalensis]
MFKISTFGDSHSRYFEITPQVADYLPQLKSVDVKQKQFTGSTITGFGKKKSTLNVRERILANVRADDDAVLLAFGQVDIELGYFYREIVKEMVLDFDEFAAGLVDTYMDFVEGMRKDTGKTVVVKGINLSVLTWNRSKAVRYTVRILNQDVASPEHKRAYKQKLVEIFPDFTVIDWRHRRFNELLRKACEARGIFYYDINDAIAESPEGRVKPDLVPEEFDHHLVSSMGVGIAHWKPLIGPVIPEAIPDAVPAEAEAAD